MKIAFVGCGRRGRHHMTAFRDMDDVEIAGVSDPVLEARESAANDFGSTAYSSVDELIDGAQPDAVVVAAPAHLNVSAALPVLRHGIPTLIEKPPGLSSAETHELLEAATRASAEVMVGFDRRFNPFVSAALELLGGSSGITQITGEFHKDLRAFTADPRYFAAMYDYTMLDSPIHAIDLIRHLAGSRVSRVASVVRRARSEYRDVHAALIEFENGTVAQFSANYTTGGRLERYEIHGTQKSVCLEGVQAGWVIENDQIEPLEPPESDSSIRIQDRYFADRVVENAPFEWPAASLQDAIETLELADSIYAGGNW